MLMSPRFDSFRLREKNCSDIAPRLLNFSDGPQCRKPRNVALCTSPRRCLDDGPSMIRTLWRRTLAPTHDEEIGPVCNMQTLPRNSILRLFRNPLQIPNGREWPPATDEPNHCQTCARLTSRSCGCDCARIFDSLIVINCFCHSAQTCQGNIFDYSKYEVWHAATLFQKSP
jgi:hypothetical protein